MVLLGGTNFNSQFIFLCVFYTILGKPICYDFFRFHTLGGMERFFIREGKAFKDALDGSIWVSQFNIKICMVLIVLTMDVKYEGISTIRLLGSALLGEIILIGGKN